MVGIKLDLSYPKITFSRGRNDGRDSELRSKVPKVTELFYNFLIF